MARYLLTLVFILLASIGYSQVSYRKYINRDRQQVDSAQADSYLFVMKAADDSVWVVNQFGMSGWLMSTGSYKDEKLTIQHGPFAYYTLLTPYFRVAYNFKLHRIDTLQVSGHMISSRGNYLNGKKSGAWIEQDTLNGWLKTESTYKNGLLDGPYKMYFPGGVVSLQGKYVNDAKEGEWYAYANDGTLSHTYIFQHNNIINQVTAPVVEDENLTQNFEFLADLAKYTNRRLSNNMFSTPGKFIVTYAFTIAQDGSITSPSILRESTMELDTTIVYAMLSAPNKIKIKGKQSAVVGKSYFLGFDITVDNRKHINLRPVVMHRNYTQQ